MADARFEDGDERPLNLFAQDGDDLGVISALVQDSVLPVTEMTYDSRRRRGDHSICEGQNRRGKDQGFHGISPCYKHSNHRLCHQAPRNIRQRAADFTATLRPKSAKSQLFKCSRASIAASTRFLTCSFCRIEVM